MSIQTISLPIHLVKTIASFVRLACDTHNDPTLRYALDCVALDLSTAGKVYAVATDGRRLHYAHNVISHDAVTDTLVLLPPEIVAILRKCKGLSGYIDIIIDHDNGRISCTANDKAQSSASVAICEGCFPSQWRLSAQVGQSPYVLGVLDSKGIKGLLAAFTETTLIATLHENGKVDMSASGSAISGWHAFNGSLTELRLNWRYLRDAMAGVRSGKVKIAQYGDEGPYHIETSDGVAVIQGLKR